MPKTEEQIKVISAHVLASQVCFIHRIVWPVITKSGKIYNSHMQNKTYKHSHFCGACWLPFLESWISLNNHVLTNFLSITICFSNKKLNHLIIEKNLKEKRRSQIFWCFNKNSRICLKGINGRCVNFCNPSVIIFFITNSITVLISTAFSFFSNS